MSGNMAFFFDLVALDLVALCLVALCLVALCLVARPGASMCCTLHHSAPPITPPISHRKIRWDKVLKLW